MIAMFAGSFLKLFMLKKCAAQITACHKGFTE